MAYVAPMWRRWQRMPWTSRRMEKVFIRANDLVRDAFALAKRIYDSGYIPDVLLVLWRGGTPVGIVIHEFLHYKGIETYHTAVKAESYVGIGQRVEPQIEHMETVLEHVTPQSRVLVIDDIFDSGATMRKVIDMLAGHVTALKIATLYYKSDANTTEIIPDYYGRKTDRWIVFPHELVGLNASEIQAKDSAVAALLG